MIKNKFRLGTPDPYETSAVLSLRYWKGEQRDERETRGRDLRVTRYRVTSYRERPEFI